MSTNHLAIHSLADQETFEKMCAGKEQYSSESGASAALKTLRKNKLLRRASNLHVYACKFGEHWHFGH